MSLKAELVDELQDVVDDLREIRIQLQPLQDSESRNAKRCITMAINATEETKTWLEP